MSDARSVKITPAKGRPMLTWVGKRPLSQVTAFPQPSTLRPSRLPVRQASRLSNPASCLSQRAHGVHPALSYYRVGRASQPDSRCRCRTEGPLVLDK